MPLPKLTEPLAIVVKGSVFVLFTGGFLVFKVLSVFFLVVSVPDSGLLYLSSRLPQHQKSIMSIRFQLFYRKISIHTPLAGSDTQQPQLLTLNAHFNPHSPRGE